MIRARKSVSMRVTAVCLLAHLCFNSTMGAAGERDLPRNDESCGIPSCDPSGKCSCVKPPRPRSKQRSFQLPKSEEPQPSCGNALLQGRRVMQEDYLQMSLLNLPTSGTGKQTQVIYFAVFDGHQGHRAARDASDQIHQLLQDSRRFRRGDFDGGLLQAFEQFQSRFLEEADTGGLTDGSTAVVALLQGTHLTLANLGDSRAVLLRIEKNGTFGSMPLTIDHKPNLPNEQHRIEAAGGFVRFERGTYRVQGELAVSRSFGDFQLKQWLSAEPDIFKYNLSHGDDVIILASDGLWDVMSAKDTAEFVLPRLYNSLGSDDDTCNRISQELVHEGYSRGSKDNIAVVLMDLRPLWTSHFANRYRAVGMPGQLQAMLGLDRAPNVNMDSLAVSKETSVELVSGDRVGSLGQYLLQEKVFLIRARQFDHPENPRNQLDNQSVYGTELFDVPMDLLESQEQQLQARVGLLEDLIGGSDRAEPDDLALLYSELGNAHESLGNFESAISSYEKGLEIGSKRKQDEVLSLRLADLYLAQSRPREAMKCAQVFLNNSLNVEEREPFDAFRGCRRLLRSMDMLHQQKASSAKGEGLKLPHELEKYLKTCSDEPWKYSTDSQHVRDLMPWDHQRMAGLNYSKLSEESALTAAEEALKRSVSSDPVSVLPQGDVEVHSADTLVRSMIEMHGEFNESIKAKSEFELVDSQSTSSRAPAHWSKPEIRRRREYAHDMAQFKREQAKTGQGLAEQEMPTSWADSGSSERVHGGYDMFESIGAGKFGEVWKAKLHGGSTDETSGETYILKRLFVEKGHAVLLSGMREIYFGEKLKGVPHVCRFVDSFEETDERGLRNLWLVFYDEGLSLRSFLYQSTVEGDLIRFHPSTVWKDMRRQDHRSGGALLRELMRQLLQGVHEAHKKNVTHRDLKPDNLIVHILSPKESHKDGNPRGPVLKLADFGSSLHPEVVSTLYGADGPSVLEETLDYAPPEVVFAAGKVAVSGLRPSSYDVWSIGVIFLELVLGTSKVFQIDGRSKALLDRKLLFAAEHVREQAYLFRAMVSYCIYPPSPPTRETTGSELISHRCSDTALQELIRQRDELGLGLPSIWAVKLLRRLLAWNPEERITAEKALQHAYFQKDPAGFTCQKNGMVTEFEFEDDAEQACK